MATKTVEKAAPAVFVVQPGKALPIIRGSQTERLRTWERMMGETIGYKFSSMRPEGPNETICGSGDGWDDCKYDVP